MFYNQLSKLCKRYKTTPTAFVTEKLGLSSSKITAWKNGSIPKYGTLEDIANYFQVPISYLFQEDDEQLSNVLKDDEKQLISLFKGLSEENKARVLERAAVLAELAAERERAAKSSEKCIALSSTSAPAAQAQEDFYIDICSLPASAGTGVFLDDVTAEPLKIVHTDIAERANYAVRVSGDSMNPEYCDGDIVLVETCPSVNVGEIGIFIVDGEGYIKQFGGDKLISLNPKYADISLRSCESAFCRGRVLGIAEPIR